MNQCLEDRHRTNYEYEACNSFIADLVLPLHLQPLLPAATSHYAMLVAPLFLLAVSVLILSLLASHQLSRTPIHQLGKIGSRGRKYFSWNEVTTGDCGGRIWDWWIFGGSVWIRFLFGIGYLVCGHGAKQVEEGQESDVGGKNLLACFGVAHDASQTTTVLGKGRDKISIDKGSRPKRSQASLGILGYDSSLGANGPFVLAPLRASILLLAWCSICSFLVMTHMELVHWIANKPISSRHESLDSSVSYMILGIRSVINAGEVVISGDRYTSHPAMNIVISTIVYASFYIAIAETSLYALGKMCTALRIYVPRGVSHPGGPRPHKIVRMPKWKEGMQHMLSEEALYVNKTKWRCAVAQDAHLDTDTKFGHTGSSRLTGEPFGRQIWTMMKSQLPSGQGGIEDDLETKLENIHCGTKVQNGDSTVSEESTNIFSPIIDMLNNEKKGQLMKKKPQIEFFGSFVQGLLPGSNSKQDKDLDLIQSLASGGRFPPLAFDPSKNPNSCDQLFRAQMISAYLENNDGKLPEDLSFMHQNQIEGGHNASRPNTAREAAKRGVAFYSMLQTSDGHFAGDYGGPHFLLPGIIVAWYVMGQPSIMISPADRVLMLHYLKVHQQVDGGWGTHIESPSTMFGAVICYLAVRLLGADKDDEWVKNGREFIQKEGGAVMTSSWAKFWLCIIGCMDWKGHNSVPPEMWLLPNWFPFHPGRLWCHCRMVYLPMGYLYGSRFIYSRAETDPLISELRNELYCQPYGSIKWDSTRHLVADMDNYSPIPSSMKFAQNCLSMYENWFIFRPFRNAARKAGLKFCFEYMQAEDLQTNYIDIGPVNKSLNMVAAYHAANSDINDEAVRKHMMRVPDYLWVAEDGMKMQGYNGSQCWDTSFAIQAIWECGLLDTFPVLSAKVWSYLERTQILSTETSQSSPAYQYESCDNRDKFYRHVSKGGWPFSTSAHGWPISDCTGEGLKGVLALMDSPSVMGAVRKGILKGMEPSRLYDAVNVILTLQNEDGGWATYENNRGFGWYEELNPSEVFGDIMIDYSYVECSMASLTALAEFHERFPRHRTTEIAFAIRRGADFIKSIQRDDGSWYGSWACCFCYGCWFGIEGLIKAGESHTAQPILKCCKFLLSQQRANGGWGEDFTSCYDKDYAQNGMQNYGDDGSGVVNTAWALMALSAAKCTDVVAVRRGVQYLMRRQLDCGDWPQEGISGVFNRACGITYTAYRNVFPIWALGRCVATYGSAIDVDE